MDKMIGYCGVDCSKCVPYIAKKENNDDLRKQYAEEQSKFFEMEIPPENINCDGCPGGAARKRISKTALMVMTIAARSSKKFTVSCARYSAKGPVMWLMRRLPWMKYARNYKTPKEGQSGSCQEEITTDH